MPVPARYSAQICPLCRQVTLCSGRTSRICHTGSPSRHRITTDASAANISWNIVYRSSAVHLTCATRSQLDLIFRSRMKHCLLPSKAVFTNVAAISPPKHDRKNDRGTQACYHGPDLTLSCAIRNIDKPASCCLYRCWSLVSRES